MSSPPTGEVTFFFTDIQGSTRLWERDARRMRRALGRHDEIMKGVVEYHGGYVFKMVGDACCAAFPSAPEALEAALEAQRAIFKEPWDEECKIRVRMALHSGEAEEIGGDYFGPSVNRVARLLSSGHGGQTLISCATRERLGEKLPKGTDLKDMGEHSLKDLKDPEHIFQLLAPELPSEFPPLKTLEAPSEDDRYRLIKKVGSGGMAEVYLAYDEVLEREVAFKVLDRKHAENKEAIERFRREARNAASLHHPNIVSIHDRGHTEDGTYYIVMEYMEGGTLEDLIHEEGHLPPQRATEITLEVARALSLAHEKGVIHRDIKPQNILLSKSGEAKVADFGIARAATATTMTQVGSVMGTVHYMSPEQALGEPTTPKSDLYSLGVVLYEMLTGELPYDAETPAGVVMKHVGGLSRSSKVANPEVPEELDAVTARLLSRNPEDRYPDGNALAEDLERVKEGLAPDAETMKARTRVRRAGRLQRRGVLAVLALVLVSVGVVAAVAFTREPPAGDGQENPPARGAGAPALEGKKLPEVGDIRPGKYATDEFKPPVSFTLGGEHKWQIMAQSPEVLFVTAADFEVPKGRPNAFPPGLSFVNPSKSYKPFEPGASPELAPAPRDMVAWIRNHPDLRVEKSEPVTVGGVSGMQFDVSVIAQKGGDVSLFRIGEDDFFLANENEYRLIALNDVAGETVLIDIEAPKGQLEAFLPDAQKVLDTVDWQGAS